MPKASCLRGRLVQSMCYLLMLSPLAVGLDQKIQKLIGGLECRQSAKTSCCNLERDWAAMVDPYFYTAITAAPFPFPGTGARYMDHRLSLHWYCKVLRVLQVQKWRSRAAIQLLAGIWPKHNAAGLLCIHSGSNGEPQAADEALPSKIIALPC